MLVQIFYAWRIYVLGRTRWLPITICCVSADIREANILSDSYY